MFDPSCITFSWRIGAVICISRLTQDWLVLDAFEDDIYTLERVTLTDGRTALAYVCRDVDQVESGSWSADEFAKESLSEYAARCQRWREQHDAPVDADPRGTA